MRGKTSGQIENKYRISRTNPCEYHVEERNVKRKKDDYVWGFPILLWLETRRKIHLNKAIVLK